MAGALPVTRGGRPSYSLAKTECPVAPMAEPAVVLVKRYECPFCNRRRSAKKATAEHMARCWLNPAAKACKTCAHFTDEPDGDYCLGTPCACNQGYQQCEAGRPEPGAGHIVTGCPLWQLREVPS